ncbi:alcohol dehydrogenase [Mycetocola manganoxydans]|uniref:alcohol dehydrogenase n=1 Tax=Mycetocola manganoxydans TaxID=699879 RepID=A0A3L6ZYS9_9MICO|nr:alcohol dehydrogenase catalytic domain-containing protein [Mycetocola manganoxydans]RLP72888.1 alcohol dehydrogenase [Mycetocola manganoxydans]GHD45127.1 alcohol dehydrogenase [Mycetocola manganoxydans]
MTRQLISEVGRDVLVRPSPFAMVWQGKGSPHEALAVPGVALGPGELLVEVELATICRSDVHTVLGQREGPAPVILGHEQVGRVVAVGEGAVTWTGTPIVAGMRVAWSVTVSCGNCDRCSRGLTQKCRTLARYGHDRVHRGWELSGGFASHVQVRAGSAVVLVGESMPARVAAPASCATATVAAALEAASAHAPLRGATVLVLGAGMSGLTATAMATDAGAHVIVSDPVAARRSAAFDFGAAAVADPGVGYLAVTGLGGVLAASAAAGAAEPLVVLETSGSPAAFRSALRAVGIGGIVVLVGSVSPGAEVTLDPEVLVRNALTVRGVHNYSGRNLQQAIDYLSDAWHSHPFADLVGETFPLALLDDALECAASGPHPRVGIDPRV